MQVEVGTVNRGPYSTRGRHFFFDSIPSLMLLPAVERCACG